MSHAQSPIQERSVTPPLTPPAAVDLNDEETLKAVAAREVARELDALTFNPPYRPPSPPIPSPYSPKLRAIVTDPPPQVTSFSPPRNDSPHSPSRYVRERDRIMPPATSPLRDNPPESGLPSYSETSSPLPATSPSPVYPTSVPSPPSLSSITSSNSMSTYHTPNEQPSSVIIGTSPSTSPIPSLSKANGSTSLQAALMTPSLVQIPSASLPPAPQTRSPTQPSPSSTRTISAAAFRRPQNPMASDSNVANVPQLGNIADTSPLFVKKRGLPSSPYGIRRGVGYRSSSSASSLPHTSQSLLMQPPSAPQQPSVPPPPPRRSESPHQLQDYEQFDYISAYVNEAENDQEQERGRVDSIR